MGLEERGIKTVTGRGREDELRLRPIARYVFLACHFCVHTTLLGMARWPATRPWHAAKEGAAERRVIRVDVAAPLRLRPLPEAASGCRPPPTAEVFSRTNKHGPASAPQTYSFFFRLVRRAPIRALSLGFPSYTLKLLTPPPMAKRKLRYNSIDSSEACSSEVVVVALCQYW